MFPAVRSWSSCRAFFCWLLVNYISFFHFEFWKFFAAGTADNWKEIIGVFDNQLGFICGLIIIACFGSVKFLEAERLQNFNPSFPILACGDKREDNTFKQLSVIPKSSCESWIIQAFLIFFPESVWKSVHSIWLWKWQKFHLLEKLSQSEGNIEYRGECKSSPKRYSHETFQW